MEGSSCQVLNSLINLSIMSEIIRYNMPPDIKQKVHSTKKSLLIKVNETLVKLLELTSS